MQMISGLNGVCRRSLCWSISGFMVTNLNHHHNFTWSSPQCVCQQTLSWWGLMFTTGYALPGTRNTTQLSFKTAKVALQMALTWAFTWSWHLDWHTVETAPPQPPVAPPPSLEPPSGPAHPPRWAARHTRRASGTVRQQKAALSDRKKTKIHFESKHYFDRGLPEHHRRRRTLSW